METLMLDKILMYGLLALMAIPIPISLMSWVGTLISLGAFSDVNWHHPKSAFGAINMLLAMIIAGTYVVTYAFSCVYTLRNDEVSTLTVLPLVHIGLFALTFVISNKLNL